MDRNFKLKIVFWNNFFGRFEKRISLFEKKTPLDYTVVKIRSETPNLTQT